MQIHLHLGAHKTATTYIQSVLAANRRSLNAAGIGYLALSEVRQLLTKPLARLSPETFRPEQHLGRFFPSGVPEPVVGLIISDENLVGACAGLVRSGNAYAIGPSRLRRLRRSLRGHKVRMFFAVRSYDTFLASAYCEFVQNRGFIPFSEFDSGIDWENFRWSVILPGFSAALGPKRVSYWRYESFSQSAEKIVRALAFDYQGPLAMQATAGAVRSSMSQISVDILHQVCSVAGKEAADALIRPLTEALPKSGSVPTFNPWSAERQLQLTRMYSEDCESLPTASWL